MKVFGKPLFQKSLVFSFLFLGLTLGAGQSSGINLRLNLDLPVDRVYSAIGKPQLDFSASQQPLLSLKLKLSREITVNYNRQSDLLFFKEVYYGYDQLATSGATAVEPFRERLLENQWRDMWREKTKQLRRKARQGKSGSLLRFELPIPIRSRVIKSIIGEGGAGLQINGYRKITVSGKSQWNDQTSVATAKQSKFPSLNMEQISSFTIKGNIGSKITVDVNQDSKRQQSLANRIQLRYKGEEDDIIKTIELGNTNLALPASKYIGYSQNIQGLFGVKTTAQIGGLELTAIASQEKSSNEGATFTAGAESTEKVSRDYQYLDNRYFFLTNPYLLSVNDLKPGYLLTGDSLAPSDSITKLELFLPTKESYASKCSLYVDPNDRHTWMDEALVRKCFDKIDYEAKTKMEVSYFYHATEHYIRIDRPMINSYFGVYIEFQRPGEDTIRTIGDISRPDSSYKILKLIRHENPDTGMVTWDYVWRNVYDLGGRIDDPDNLEVRIFKGNATRPEDRDESELDHLNGESYLHLLGLDADDDGLLDHSNQIVDYDLGHLFFPNWRPFIDPVLSPDTVPELYYSKNQSDRTRNSKYYLLVNSSSRKKEFYLGHFDIVEGSETVMLNGRPLKNGVDYRISYEMGRISFLSEEALDPNARVEVNYEYAPLITSEKKTLLGVRGEYKRGRNFKMGTTVLYKAEKTTDRKPRIGEEQSRFINLDTDVSYSFESQGLTNLMNLLPLINSEATSRIMLSGEVGQSFPNPNVVGEAFIDDFEGARERYSLGVTRGGWRYGSRPQGVLPEAKGRIIWYNPFDQPRITEIYDREVRAGEDRTHVLIMRLTPESSNQSLSWGGIMKALSSGVYDQTKTEYIELRMKGETGVLHIDLGEITEDVIENDTLDSEDLYPQNGILEEGEDVGLDGLADADEVCADPDNCDPNDPAGDNWAYDNTDHDNYENINGTEDNATDPGTYGYPDTEDISRSGFIDKANNYFSFRINLDPDSNIYRVPDSDRNGWYTVRIPFQDSSAYSVIGKPNRGDIRFARLWIDGVKEINAFISIAQVELTRNLWEVKPVLPLDKVRDSIDAPTFRVSVANDEENENYTSPEGVAGFFDKTSGLTEKEQSLSLDFSNLAPGDTGIAEKFPYKQQDLTGYRQLEMWVHGDMTRENLEFFFRVGPDSLNFYEYKTTIVEPGWSRAHSVKMVFDEMTPLKLDLQELPDSLDINEFSRGHYRVVGRPSLTKVKYYAVGVANVDTIETATADSVGLTGNIWINELRVSDVRNDRGLAGVVNAQVALGDIFSISADYSVQDAFFRKLTSANRGNLGSGREQLSQSYRLSFQFDKILPKSVGARIPISYGWSRSTEIPRLITGSDIAVPPERAEEEKTVRTQYSFSIRESFSNKSKNPLFSLFLNRFKSNLSYSKASSRSPTQPVNETERYTAAGNYKWNHARLKGIKIFSPLRWLRFPSGITDTDFSPIPMRFDLSGNLDCTRQYSKNNFGKSTSRYTRTFKGKLSTSADPFPGVNLAYSMNTDRDLDDPDLVRLSYNPKTFKLGQERSFKESFTASWKPKLTSFITGTKLSFTANHTENLDPKRQTGGTRRVDNSRNFSINSSFNIKRLLGVGKSRQPTASPERQRSGRGKRRGSIVDTLHTPSDSTDAEEKEEPKPPGIPIYEYPLRLVQLIVDRIDPIGGSYSRDKRFSRNGFLERPSVWYRLGLSENPRARSISVTGSAAQVDAESELKKYSLSSGISLPLGIKIGSRWAFSTSEASNKHIRDESTTFPNFSFDFSKFYPLKFTKLFAGTFNLDSKYTQTEKKSVNRTGGFTETSVTSRNYSPLLSIKINWKFAPAFSTQIKYTKTQSDRHKYFTSGANIGQLDNCTKDFSSSIAVNNSYTFRGGSKIKFPLLGTLRVKTNLSVNLDVSTNSNKSERHDPGQPVNELDAKTDFTVQTRATYSFSSKIQGGATFRWRDSTNKKTNRNTHMREVGFWVEIKF